MYRIGRNAQQSCHGAERPAGDEIDFSDQDCGIAAPERAVAVATGRNRRRRSRKIASLLDEFQQWTTLAMRRFRILRPFRRRIIPLHRIAQSLQFRFGNPIELHSKLENCYGHQMGGVRMGAVDETRPALLERRENQMQSFF